MLSQLKRQFNISKLSSAAKYVRRMGGGGHDHHHHMMPPFARLAPPKEQIPEEIELVWDDSVAPETCVDFEAPQISTTDGLKSVGYAILFFVGLMTAIVISDPVGSNPVALRATVIPHNMLSRELGIATSGDDEEEAEEE